MKITLQRNFSETKKQKVNSVRQMEIPQKKSKIEKYHTIFKIRKLNLGIHRFLMRKKIYVLSKKILTFEVE